MCKWINNLFKGKSDVKGMMMADPVKIPEPQPQKQKQMEAKDYFNIIKSKATEEGMPVTLATFIAAQAAHETGGFTSDVFTKCNNCFGYKYVEGAGLQNGPCNISPEGNAYAHYADIEHSVVEICDWIKRRLKEGRFPALVDIKTPLQYATLLKNCGYYGDTLANYTAGIANGLRNYA